MKKLSFLVLMTVAVLSSTAQMHTVLSAGASRLVSKSDYFMYGKNATSDSTMISRFGIGFGYEENSFLPIWKGAKSLLSFRFDFDVTLGALFQHELTDDKMSFSFSPSPSVGIAFTTNTNLMFYAGAYACGTFGGKKFESEDFALNPVSLGWNAGLKFEGCAIELKKGLNDKLTLVSLTFDLKKELINLFIHVVAIK